MGSNWIRVILNIQHPGFYELFFLIDNEYLPNFPVKIKAFTSNPTDEKNKIVQFSDEKNLFVGKVLELYTNIDITLKSSIKFKGPSFVDFLYTPQSSGLVQIVFVCSVPGIYQLFIQEQDKNVNMCKKIFSVKPTPPHYFNGVILPFEGLVNSLYENLFSPEIVTFAYSSTCPNTAPIYISSTATVIAEMKSITFPNTVFPILVTKESENNFKVFFKFKIFYIFS